jgi:hypothetical protein
MQGTYDTLGFGEKTGANVPYDALPFDRRKYVNQK